MNRQQIILIASALAVVLSLVIITRSISSRTHFDKSVKASLATSEGYDQQFINMVNRLEDLLVQRAQFGFPGGKDPMTGTKRQVVRQKKAPTKSFRKTTQQAVAKVDPIRLTAIIADAAEKNITAVIMDGERSFSVNRGDRVAGRQITRITNDGIYMESDTESYFYDIHGNTVVKKK